MCMSSASPSGLIEPEPSKVIVWPSLKVVAGAPAGLGRAMTVAIGGVSSARSCENSDVFPGSVAVAETIALLGSDALKKVNEALPSLVVSTVTLPT